MLSGDPPEHTGTLLHDLSPPQGLAAGLRDRGEGSRTSGRQHGLSARSAGLLALDLRVSALDLGSGLARAKGYTRLPTEAS